MRQTNTIYNTPRPISGFGRFCRLATPTVVVVCRSGLPCWFAGLWLPHRPMLPNNTAFTHCLRPARQNDHGRPKTQTSAEDQTSMANQCGGPCLHIKENTYYKTARQTSSVDQTITAHQHVIRAQENNTGKHQGKPNQQGRPHQ